MGQHLLIDPNLQRKTVDLLGAKPGDNIMEIGPGLGALTFEMLERGYKVWAVEKDARFVKVLSEEYGNYLNLNFFVHHGDILQCDLVSFLARPTNEGPLKVMGNLPYYITAPIFFYLFENARLFSRGVFTIQKEVAKRLVASPGTKDYGRLTLAVRYFAEVTHAFDIPPRCFTPQPEVESSVVVFKFRAKDEMLDPEMEKKVFDLIRTAFGQRRKTFLHLLKGSPLHNLSREELIALFESLGWKSTVRGEELLFKDFLALAQALER